MTDLPGPVNLDDDAYYRDPAGFFAPLRESAPAVRARMPDGRLAWLITRYEDVRATLADPRLGNDVSRFPGRTVTRPSEGAGGVHAHLLNTDPPHHDRMRRLAQKAFTPRAVDRLRPYTEDTAKHLLDEAGPARGTVDLLGAYARPLPIAVLCELLGIPKADQERIGAAVSGYGKGDREKDSRVTGYLAAYLTDLIAAKRADPGDDLLTALALVRDDVEEDGSGQGLTYTEVRSLAFQIIMGGFDTTVNLIGNGVLALLTHPGELARLKADPSLIRAALEELLRFGNPLQHATDRFTLEEVTIGGVTVPAGEWVFAATTAANRDPARYPDPDRLDLGRDTSGHVAFGHGIHYCLGAFLARMGAEVALGALLARFPEMELAAAPEELRWRPVSLMHGLEELPVRLR
ncbi:MAG: cytochrome P450 [Streptosporangiales bacterium]|nr:cytochrome P450 [Streptosporangiales bacterium]